MYQLEPTERKAQSQLHKGRRRGSVLHTTPYTSLYGKHSCFLCYLLIRQNIARRKEKSWACKQINFRNLMEKKIKNRLFNQSNISVSYVCVEKTPCVCICLMFVFVSAFTEYACHLSNLVHAYGGLQPQATQTH